MVKIKLNGVEVSVEEGSTLLEAAQFMGFPIPTLCHMEGLTPYGACRLCVVEVEGSVGKLETLCIAHHFFEPFQGPDHEMGDGIGRAIHDLGYFFEGNTLEPRQDDHAPVVARERVESVLQTVEALVAALSSTLCRSRVGWVVVHRDNGTAPTEMDPFVDDVFRDAAEPVRERLLSLPLEAVKRLQERRGFYLDYYGSLTSQGLTRMKIQYLFLHPRNQMLMKIR